MMNRVLQREGLRREDFLTHQVKGMILREEPRRAVVVPSDLSNGPLERDEVHRGRNKLTLTFSLPRGAYATMLIKRLFAGPMFADDGRRHRTSRWRGSAGAGSNGP